MKINQIKNWITLLLIVVIVSATTSCEKEIPDRTKPEVSALVIKDDQLNELDKDVFSELIWLEKEKKYTVSANFSDDREGVQYNFKLTEDLSTYKSGNINEAHTYRFIESLASDGMGNFVLTIPDSAGSGPYVISAECTDLEGNRSESIEQRVIVTGNDVPVIDLVSYSSTMKLEDTLQLVGTISSLDSIKAIYIKIVDPIQQTEWKKSISYQSGERPLTVNLSLLDSVQKVVLSEKEIVNDELRFFLTAETCLQSRNTIVHKIDLIP